MAFEKKETGAAQGREVLGTGGGRCESPELCLNWFRAPDASAPDGAFLLVLMIHCRLTGSHFWSASWDLGIYQGSTGSWLLFSDPLCAQRNVG